MSHRQAELNEIGWNPDSHSAEKQMEAMVACLNGPTPLRWPKDGKKTKVRLRPIGHEKELRRLVELWRASGPNLQKLFAQEPEIAAYSQKPQMKFWPTDTGRGYLEWVPADPYDGSATARVVALDHLMMLIMNPQWDTLGGPCVNCKDYFIRGTDRARLYCSAACGAKVTAKIAMKAKREREHREKLERAKEKIEEWAQKKRRVKWEAWVLQGVEFTDRWLSRAVNKGEIIPPSVVVR